MGSLRPRPQRHPIRLFAWLLALKTIKGKLTSLTTPAQQEAIVRPMRVEGSSLPSAENLRVLQRRLEGIAMTRSVALGNSTPDEVILLGSTSDTLQVGTNTAIPLLESGTSQISDLVTATITIPIQPDPVFWN